MLTLRITAGGARTGILLLDRARINRYDIAVPVFGLAALWAFNRAERGLRPAWYALLTGAFTALARPEPSLRPVLAAGVCRPDDRAARPRCLSPEHHRAAAHRVRVPVVAMARVRGLGVVRLSRTNAPGQRALRPVQSLVLRGQRPSRRRPDLTRLVGEYDMRALPFARVGTWTMGIGCPAACATMLWVGRHRGGGAGYTLAVAALAQTAMFVALLKVKTVSYMIALWPLWAVLLAWFGVWLWDRQRTALRAALLALLAVIVVEAVTRVAHAHNTAKQTSPYDWFESEVAGCIPSGALVLGLQHYWLGLRLNPTGRGCCPLRWRSRAPLTRRWTSTLRSSASIPTSSW